MMCEQVWTPNSQIRTLEIVENNCSVQERLGSEKAIYTFKPEYFNDTNSTFRVCWNKGKLSLTLLTGSSLSLDTAKTLQYIQPTVSRENEPVCYSIALIPKKTANQSIAKGPKELLLLVEGYEKVNEYNIDFYEGDRCS